jgi:hypothetical protein
MFLAAVAFGVDWFSCGRVWGISARDWTTAILTRHISLSSRLALLVVGTTLPAILFAGGVIYASYVRERQAAFDRVLETVRGIRLVVDAELQGITAGLEVLAASRSLELGDLVAFRESVERGAAVQQQCCARDAGAAAGQPRLHR